MHFRLLILLLSFALLALPAYSDERGKERTENENTAEADTGCSLVVTSNIHKEEHISHLKSLRAHKPYIDLVRVYDSDNFQFRCGIYLPKLTADCMMDIGMTLWRWPVPFSLVPHWFTNFGPTTCNETDLYLAPKCLTSIQIKMRAYF